MRTWQLSAALPGQNVVIPSGPRTSGAPWALSYSESNAVDHTSRAPLSESRNLSTLPVRETPNGPGAMSKYLPVSDTYRLPRPSNATPRGPSRPDTTGVNVQPAPDAPTGPFGAMTISASADA